VKPQKKVTYVLLNEFEVWNLETIGNPQLNSGIS
jgi:hypothetical protein